MLLLKRTRLRTAAMKLEMLHTCLNWFALCSLRFVIAALESTQFVRFAFPSSNPPFCNSNSPCPSGPSRSIRPLNASGSQKTRRPAATFSRSGCQAEAHGNTAARADGRNRALADDDDESDDDLPSLEELTRTALRRKVSTEASKTESTVQRLEQPALNGAGLALSLGVHKSFVTPFLRG